MQPSLVQVKCRRGGVQVDIIGYYGEARHSRWLGASALKVTA
jgi:hypothetical protein